MLAVLTISGIIIIAGVILIFSLKKKEQYKREVLPKQIKLVNELVDDLKASRIEVLVIEENDNFSDQYNRFKGLTLLEISKCIDNNSDLSLEKYDEYAVFIEEPCKIINIPKYLFNRYMPKEIRNELRSFNTGNHEKITSPESPCIILAEAKTNNVTREFIKINAEGYESWQQFKESAHSLNFVIKQWLKENTQVEKEELVLA